MAAIRQRQGGKVDDAMAMYLEIANRYPDDRRAPEALFQLAQQALRSKRPDKETEVRSIFTRTATQYPDGPLAPRALMARSELEERRKLWKRDEVLAIPVPSSLATYREVVERYGTHPEVESARWKLGNAYASIERYDLAAATFTDLAIAFPATSYDAWFAAGEIYDRRLKDRANAISAYLRVPASSPRFKDAQKRAAR